LGNKNILIIGEQEWEELSGQLGIYPSKRCSTFDVVTDIKKIESNIDNYVLNQNYLNPFNPSTTLTYQLPKATNVVLQVYDVLGKELVNEIKSAGVYNISFNASNLPSGLYFYKIQAGEFTAVRKMLLMK